MKMRVLWAILAVVGCTGLVRAEELTSAPVSLNIPKQALSDALNEFARQAQLHLAFYSTESEGLTSPALSGKFTPEEALRTLLEGTELTYSVIDARTVAIGVRGREGKPTAYSEGATSKEMLRVAQADEQGAEGKEEQGQRSTGEAAREGAQLDEIVVTGTHIRGAPPVGSSYLVLDQDDIERSGYGTTEQLIQSIPQNFRGGASAASADANLSPGVLRGLNFSLGSGINLRGIGSVATLVLINGRRTAPSAGGTFTDISLIPVTAIDRIEVLTDGASAIYGADAVAGVVNIVLKRDYQGSETTARYGATTDGAMDEKRLGQTLGTKWDSGAVLLAAEYMDQSELDVTERDATSNVLAPASLFAPQERLSAVLSTRQDFGGWDAQGDVQFTHKSQDDTSSHFTTIARDLSLDRLNAALGASHALFSDWKLAMDTTFSQEEIEFSHREFDVVTGDFLDVSSEQKVRQKQWGLQAKADGALFSLGGAQARLAIGAAYRDEDYLERANFSFGFLRKDVVSRHVASTFAELHLPFVTSQSARPGVRRFEVSLAARYDDYSDFGDTTNPKIGFAWSPLDQLDLRASYSTSFRAPSIGRELTEAAKGTNFISLIPIFSEDGSALIPAAFLIGSNSLRPEESENVSFGLTYRPGFAPGFTASLNYFDLRYTDRIGFPDFDLGALSNPGLASVIEQFASNGELLAAIDPFLDAGAILTDDTGGLFGADTLSQTLVTYDFRQQNIAAVDISGFDLALDYAFDLGGDALTTGIALSYFDHIRNTAAPGAPQVEAADTFGNPPDLRSRAYLNGSRGSWDHSLSINYVDGYTDTSALLDTPVDSFVTVDAQLRYRFSNGLRLALSLINAFDEGPPFIAASVDGANYDAANATPLGRLMALEAGWRW